MDPSLVDLEAAADLEAALATAAQEARNGEAQGREDGTASNS
jgi:hypothetical protein